MMPSEIYRNTAGGIEARDTAKRRSMTAEERRQTMPDRGDENTVFAEGGWDRSLEYDPKTASIKEQIERYRDALNKMDVVARETVPEKLTSKGAAVKWIEDRLKASGFKVDRQGFGEILFSKKDIDKGMRYADTPEKIAESKVNARVGEEKPGFMDRLRHPGQTLRDAGESLRQTGENLRNTGRFFNRKLVDSGEAVRPKPPP